MAKFLKEVSMHFERGIKAFSYFNTYSKLIQFRRILIIFHSASNFPIFKDFHIENYENEIFIKLL